jgi:hypothetical protein
MFASSRKRRVKGDRYASDVANRLWNDEAARSFGNLHHHCVWICTFGTDMEGDVQVNNALIATAR